MYSNGNKLLNIRSTFRFFFSSLNLEASLHRRYIKIDVLQLKYNADILRNNVTRYHAYFPGCNIYLPLSLVKLSLHYIHRSA